MPRENISNYPASWFIEHSHFREIYPFMYGEEWIERFGNQIFWCYTVQKA